MEKRGQEEGKEGIQRQITGKCRHVCSLGFRDKPRIQAPKYESLHTVGVGSFAIAGWLSRPGSHISRVADKRINIPYKLAYWHRVWLICCACTGIRNTAFRIPKHLLLFCSVSAQQDCSPASQSFNGMESHPCLWTEKGKSKWLLSEA